MNAYREGAKVFKALGDEHRLQIVNILRGGEICAGDLLEKLQIEQPTLSHHMKILCDAELVLSRREGKRILYSLNKEGCRQLGEVFARMTRV